MNELLLFILLFVATGLGWLLGRRGSVKKNSAGKSRKLPSQYYQGLNYVLDGRPDGAVDAFIDALEVNSDTLETHIALGNLLRRRGEVSRAIRIHQNLLARPSLPRAQVHQAHLELARDYISAGLLDRAERLLLDLVKESPQLRRVSRRHLLKIFESEREWPEAIAVARELLPRKSLLGSSAGDEVKLEAQEVRHAMAHYHCELADLAANGGDWQKARELLRESLNCDRDCVRASIQLGEVEQQCGNPKQAIRALQRVQQQDPVFIPETVSLLRQCYRDLGNDKALKQYLEQCLDTVPSATLILAIADDMADSEGEEAAGQFLARQLRDRPSLRGLARLMHLQLEQADEMGRENLGILQALVESLLEERPVYRCSQCGFAGKQLHWFCPGCKSWGTIKSIRGLDGE